MFGFFENTIPCPDCDGAPNHFSFITCSVDNPAASKIAQRRPPCKTCGDIGVIDDLGQRIAKGRESAE